MEVVFENVSKAYGKKTVLDEVNFSCFPGGCYGLLGKNGAGKSTIINLLVQLIRPSSGKIFYNKHSYLDLPIPIKSQIGVLTDINMLIEELNVYQYLGLVGRLYNLDQKVIHKKINELINFFFEDEVPNKQLISSFSTGMKKKAAICAACLHEPNLLILDEPFTGLDIFSVKKLIKFIFSNKYR